VRELFDSFLSDDPGYSAQLSVYLRGTKVVDLCGGPGLAPGDITGTYSCSKGVAAFVIALLVQDGRLDLDRTVASYWPEFGVQGKDRLTVRQALRQKDTPFESLGLGNTEPTDAQLLDAMMVHPILINRPLVVTPRGVRLCRPSEVVLEILPNPDIGPFTKEDGGVVIGVSGRQPA